MMNFENTHLRVYARFACATDKRHKGQGKWKAKGGEKQAPDAVTQFLARGRDVRLPHRAVTRRILAPSVIYTRRFGRGRDVQENPPLCRDTTTAPATSIACRVEYTSPCRFKAFQEKHVTSPMGDGGESTPRRIPSAYSTRATRRELT